ncbi:MAG: radical SAM protein, partial [Candidatus Omnitrophica bacterium]|nr:radical SAM protein [Candidatus Omnitrophota bacterium]
PADVVPRVTIVPDYIGISLNILTVNMAVEYVHALKARFPQAQVIFGGPQASVTGQRLMERFSWLDAVIVGEGERTIVEIAARMGRPDRYEGVAGVIFRRGDAIIDNGPRPMIADLDELPRPAYHLLPHLSRYRSRSRAVPVGHIFTSRGCPAACTFCYRTFGAKWRTFSVDRVLEEIAFLKENYGIRQLDIMDDNFSFDGERAKEIFRRIIERRWDLKINLQVGVRVNSLTPELLRLMRQAGVFKFGFGIESGDKDMLKRIRKGLDLDRARALVKEARALGFITHGYFIMGFPGDTPESMQRTIDFAKELNPHYVSFSICAPLPGTEIYEDVRTGGEFFQDTVDGLEEGLFALKGIFRYGALTPEMAGMYCKKAWKEFYGRPEKILDVLGTVRSSGECQWLWRTVVEMLRSRNTAQKW